MPDIQSLISRVEAATGPNYALEIEIFKALHPEYTDYVQGRGGLVHPYDGSDARVLSDVRPPAYTASLDAAMTLAGRGYHLAFDVHFMPEDDVIRYRGYSFRPDWTKWNPHDMEWLNRDGSENPLCSTPALALVAAALRSRAQQGEG